MGYTQPMARTYQNPCPWTRVRVLTGTGTGCSEKPQGSPCPSLSTDARSANKPSKTEIIKDSQSNIKSNEAAKKWLTDYNYIIHGEDLHRTLNDTKNVYQE